MPTQPKTRILLVDDHAWVHQAVNTILKIAPDIELIGQAHNGVEALRLCEELCPDLILMDVVMPHINGIEATRIIRERYDTIKILELSSFQDDESVLAMLDSGAMGYVLKGSLTGDLISAIRTAMTGVSVFSAEITSVLLKSNHETTNGHDFGLTARELEVLRLMAKGENNPEIADKLVISQSTVKFHIVNIRDKMKVATRPEAMVLVAKNNIV
ncbi:MAG: response regulator transcription factor [Phototrophicales bacterium]|nr:response regulator transcription factor [Phototrophicales bacterium]